jgi:glycosyltransferase involved in cell wall biosynthesis
MRNEILASILVPCRNEENYIGLFLESILNQSFDLNKAEVILIDGLSEDRTVEIARSYNNQFAHFQIIQNENKTVPYALNKGIHMARGEYIIRLDAHTTYPKNYLETVLYWKKKLQAGNIGCVLESKGRSSWGEAIANAMCSPYGVGGSSFRVLQRDFEPFEVDTVPFGVFSKSLLKQIGYFDPRFTRHQDYEMNWRIRKNGEKIYLVPGLKASYYVRDRLSDLALQYYKYGIYKGKFIRLHQSIKLRHFMPMSIVMALLFNIALIPFVSAGTLLLATSVLSIPYLLFILTSSLMLSLKSKKHLLKYLQILPTLHLSYGFGSILGIFSRKLEQLKFFYPY